MNQPRNKIEQNSEKNSKNSGFQPSRRQLLSQGINASLGVMFLPQLGGGGGMFLERRSQSKHPPESLLTLANPPLQASASETVSQGPITVTIHFTAKANQAKALVAQLTQSLPQIRQAPGCRYAQIYILADHPNQVVLFKGWESRIAQAKYLQWEQSSGRLAKLLALVESEPMVEYWTFQAA